ncbi:hypothetical protein llg_05330 [Luteolibacter sp. LG18]|nr:hypothetical protein llg_05330 [Luteolibacter sp. LG18]
MGRVNSPLPWQSQSLHRVQWAQREQPREAPEGPCAPAWKSVALPRGSKKRGAEADHPYKGAGESTPPTLFRARLPAAPKNKGGESGDSPPFKNIYVDANSPIAFGVTILFAG